MGRFHVGYDFVTWLVTWLSHEGVLYVDIHKYQNQQEKILVIRVTLKRLLFVILDFLLNYFIGFMDLFDLWSCRVWSLSWRTRPWVSCCFYCKWLTLCRHFSKTQHTFSMQLSSQRVWDYIGGKFFLSHSLFLSFSLTLLIFLSIDNYVHRLVQNKGDGKLVEVSGLITEVKLVFITFWFD